jgi:hypothetical protein
MPTPVTTTESIPIALDADIAAYIEQKGIKDVNTYLIQLLQQEKARQAGQ